MVTFIIIMVFQKDTGTAIVLFVIAFFEFMMAGHKSLKKFQIGMVVCVFIGIMGALVLMTPAGIHFIKNALNLPDYMVSRFEAIPEFPVLYLVKVVPLKVETPLKEEIHNTPLASVFISPT